MPERKERIEWEYTATNSMVISCSALHISDYSLRLLSNWGCGYCRLPPGCNYVGEGSVDVHGGITFDRDGVVGFDTAHFDDNDKWDLEKTRAETERLAEQLAQLVPPLVYLAHAGSSDESG